MCSWISRRNRGRSRSSSNGRAIETSWVVCPFCWWTILCGCIGRRNRGRRRSDSDRGAIEGPRIIVTLSWWTILCCRISCGYRRRRRWSSNRRAIERPRIIVTLSWGAILSSRICGWRRGCCWWAIEGLWVIVSLGWRTILCSTISSRWWRGCRRAIETSWVVVCLGRGTILLGWICRTCWLSSNNFILQLLSIFDKIITGRRRCLIRSIGLESSSVIWRRQVILCVIDGINFEAFSVLGLEGRHTALGGHKIVAGVTRGQGHRDVGLNVPGIKSDILGGAAVVHWIRANVHRLHLARVNVRAHPRGVAGLRATQSVPAASRRLVS